MQTYSDLLKNKEQSQITYQDLLLTNEWLIKRDQIINKDKNRCTKCKLSATGQHIHYDESKKEYSFLSDNGIEDVLTFTNKDGEIVTESIPRTIITNKPYHLQVHHKYYIYNKLPWEYDNDALITLCNWCHTDIHKTETIKMYENDSLIDFEELIPCDRCNGSGNFPEYSHVQGGVCFKCGGKRFEQSIVK